jgi:hypothetical protein
VGDGAVLSAITAGLLTRPRQSTYQVYAACVDVACGVDGLMHCIQGMVVLDIIFVVVVLLGSARRVRVASFS